MTASSEAALDSDVRLASEVSVEMLRAVSRTIEAMRQIAGKIGIVDEIAYQTNLLALNAAIEAGALQDRAGRAILLIEQREQQMLWFDDLVVMADRQALRIREGLLEFGGDIWAPRKTLAYSSISDIMT